jgi:hypothetical protein
VLEGARVVTLKGVEAALLQAGDGGWRVEGEEAAPLARHVVALGVEALGVEEAAGCVNGGVRVGEGVVGEGVERGVGRVGEGDNGGGGGRQGPGAEQRGSGRGHLGRLVRRGRGRRSGSRLPGAR